VVTIEVIDAETQTAMKDADVVLRPLIYRGNAYRSRTDDGGVARLSVPKDEYQLYVSGDGKEYFLPTVEIVSDITIKAELLIPNFDPNIG
jgi:hypothetical protein